jgi:hypothetical protein
VILWPCGLDVSTYAASGHDVAPPAVRCPACGGPTAPWSGYRRYLRADAPHVIFVPRVRCRSCGRTDALLPWFVLPYRRNPPVRPARDQVARVSEALRGGIGHRERRSSDRSGAEAPGCRLAQSAVGPIRRTSPFGRRHGSTARRDERVITGQPSRAAKRRGAIGASWSRKRQRLRRDRPADDSSTDVVFVFGFRSGELGGFSFGFELVRSSIPSVRATSPSRPAARKVKLGLDHQFRELGHGQTERLGDGRHDVVRLRVRESKHEGSSTHRLDLRLGQLDPVRQLHGSPRQTAP